MNKVRINSKIYGAMAEVQMSQEELARRIDRSVTYVYYRMRGIREWDTRDMYRILDVFDQPDSALPEWFPRRQGVRKCS